MKLFTKFHRISWLNSDIVIIEIEEAEPDRDFPVGLFLLKHQWIWGIHQVPYSGGGAIGTAYGAFNLLSRQLPVRVAVMPLPSFTPYNKKEGDDCG